MENRKTSFEDFLEERCFAQNDGVLDDDMPDFFDNWLSELDGEDYLEYGNLYGRMCRIEAKEEIIKSLDKKLNGTE